MKVLEGLLAEYGAECSAGNEYDNRPNIARTKEAVLTKVRSMIHNRDNELDEALRSVLNMTSEPGMTMLGIQSRCLMSVGGAPSNLGDVMATPPLGETDPK